MEKIIDFNDILLYKEAQKKLEEKGIIYSREKLFGNPELCREIIELIKYSEELK